MDELRVVFSTALAAIVSYITGLNWAAMMIWFTLMLLDVITGNIKHKQCQTWQSREMKNGLLKKAQEFFLLMAFILAQYVLEQTGVKVPFSQCFAGLFAFKELGSICENCRVSGVDLPIPMKKWFDEATEKVLGGVSCHKEDKEK